MLWHSMSRLQPLPTITSAVVRIWARWKVIAHAIGNFQARVLLSVFYFVVVPPFALIVKVKDPLGLRQRDRASAWLERPAPDTSSESAHRQF
jgi:hypothetical protein